MFHSYKCLNDDVLLSVKIVFGINGNEHKKSVENLPVVHPARKDSRIAQSQRMNNVRAHAV